MVYVSSYKFTNTGTPPLMTGLALSSAIFCILTAQVWIYFRLYMRRPHENRLIKVLVAFVWLIQAAGMALASRIAVVHTMEFKDSFHFVGHVSTEWALYSGINSLTTSLVHGFFIYRICCIEKSIYRKRMMSFVLIALCFIEQAFGLLSVIYIFKDSYGAFLSTATAVFWSMPVSLGVSAICDILIAGTLAYILHKNRTGSRRTNQIITKLVIFSLQTGLVTTMSTLIAIALWVACRFSLDHLYMCFPVGGLYATCLLANLIARESYLQPRSQTVNETLVFTPNKQIAQSSSDTRVQLTSQSA